MTLLCCRRLWFWATFWSLAWPGLVVLRLLLGASEALFFVAGFAMLADIAPTGRADEALSHSALALFTGLALGPALAQLLVRQGGYAPVWSVTALLAAAACLVRRAALVVGSSTAHGEPKPGPLYRPALRPGMALLAGGAPDAGFLAFGVLYARDLSIATWSLAPFGYAGTVVLCRIALAKLPDRLPARALASALHPWPW